MNIFSMRKAMKRLGISRQSLLKEIEEGSIRASKRRNRIIILEKDIVYYENQNIIHAMPIIRKDIGRKAAAPLIEESAKNEPGLSTGIQVAQTLQSPTSSDQEFVA